MRLFAPALVALYVSPVAAHAQVPTGWVRFRPDSSYVVGIDSAVAKEREG